MKGARDAPAGGAPDLLSATRECLRQAVRDKGRDWLNVYGEFGWPFIGIGNRRFPNSEHSSWV